MRKRIFLLFLTSLSVLISARAYQLTDSLHYSMEMQSTLSSADRSPMWLHSNRYGLSSLDGSNGHLRVSLERPLALDSARRWGLGYGIDVAAAYNHTSSFIIQQAYVEARWRRGVLAIGAREYPMELKNQQLSSGSQTLGINARPIPQLRLMLPDYCKIPGFSWLAFKGHLAYGLTTDDRWQRDFTLKEKVYTRHTMYHSKAGFLRFGREYDHISFELGLEMATQFGGSSYNHHEIGRDGVIDNEDGLRAFWNAFIIGGTDKTDGYYKNAEGNTVGSWMMRLTADYPAWQASLYADHFFEDHSMLTFISFNGYGEGKDWEKHVHSKRFTFYPPKDNLLGVELRLKRFAYINNVVVEYMTTKDQSGAIYHDNTPSMPDNVFGRDNYYNHHIFNGWQHWGQVCGNPLYLSPIYNDNGQIVVSNNRFQAWHVGASGQLMDGLHWRMLYSWQHGFGTYENPYPNPRYGRSLLAELTYEVPRHGWLVQLAYAMDNGSLRGNNSGIQFTLANRGWLQLKKKKGGMR